MRKLGDLCVKHHKVVVKGMTGVSAVLIGLLIKNMVELNRGDAVLTRDESWRKNLRDIEEYKKNHPEDNQETGA